ncbi:CBS domain-containing protein [Bacillus sp. HMF5848]|uniref:CBS domain-containing protein n=1 Tax=Bacillus sp. HMF5848 TaxID=2495421 RepID=UPI000F7A84F7|nr:CBS domain-containing protein [Bacillus sp. HMF5848]RSK29305.1 CBS domain-containing protein [Bacillus sp. HMF5848]
MTTNVESVTLLDNVFEVAVKMRDLNVGAIPVVDEGKLIGIITDRDLVVRGYAEKRSGSNEVKNVMSDKLVTVNASTTLEEAANVMAEHQVRRLPVVEGDKLIGIVSLGDLSLEKMSDQKAGQALHEISEPSSDQMSH